MTETRESVEKIQAVEEQKLIKPSQLSDHVKLGTRSQANSHIRGGVSTTTRDRSGKEVNEIVQFAGFLSDYDPSIIFVLTYD